MIHKTGSENVNADALSRAKHLDELTAEENEEYQKAIEVGEMKITFASELEGNPVEIGKERQKFAKYLPAIHNLSDETKYEIMEGNVMRKLQEEDEVWKEVIKWIIDGKVPKMQEVRGRIQEVISVRQIFNPTLFVLHNGILCYNHHTDPAKPYDALCVCVPSVKLEEVFKICHKGMAGGHRSVAGTLDKFQRTFFTMSAREKIRRLVDPCNTCLAKEKSIQAKRGPHVPSTVGNVGEKLFIDLVSMSETVRKNRNLLTVQDGFTRFASAYPICNKEAGTVAQVLICEHFSVFRLPNQIHSDNGAEFVNKLRVELFS